MKKLLFILTFSISLSLFTIKSFAYDSYFDQYGYIAIVQTDELGNVATGNWALICDDPGYPITIDPTTMKMNSNYRHYSVYPGHETYIWWGFQSPAQAMLYLNSGIVIKNINDTSVEFSGFNRGYISGNTSFNTIINVKGNNYNPSDGVYNSYQDWFNDQINNPPEPEPGSTWFDDMWNYFTDLLGLTDDFSDTLKDWIFDIGDGSGGHSGGHSFDIITPSPTPSPTPFPSPTPYDLTINYPDGTTGTITDIPGSTIIINGGDETTNNYGSDFDIFEVDLKMGDSDSVNPRDGLNSVMDSNQQYLQDIDTSPITSSFSLIPNDWFILIGVLGAIPFIAGFISKLLK